MIYLAKENNEMFINNKYTTIYNSIIENSLQRNLSCYVEKHHIIPKCLGGTDEKFNIATLTAREHFICHRLLVKMVVSGPVRGKLSYAAWAMSNMQNKYQKDRYTKITSKEYEKLKTIIKNELVVNRATGEQSGSFKGYWFTDNIKNTSWGEINNR